MTTTASEAGSPTIRPAEDADLLAVFRIEKASFNQPWPFSAFERFVGEPTFLVAVDGGKVVGYVVADVIPNHGRGLGHVKDIAVHPARRGEGIGRTLLQRALSGLRAHGAHSVKLEVRASNEGAISLYRKFGFHYLRTVPRYYGDGEDAIVMVVELD
ncbi:ribosomal protein S18-alanine N-acetyltransferase [Haladaptatus salinisoli]|uniref:ribosomal protein S18-alanine N-acetyltransferase n=1 Tax=Haladaptatus salinisoli TaxID=2884876 RepID=UPI001D0BE17B|nr:ribosomal protein S18-alanine N-acetyltransferase [Haladaptatus salinisoli]